MPPTETSTATATATGAPTAEATLELTPPAEVTAEVTVEITPELTAETTAEAPTVTPTASETPLPPEPNWVLISSGDFEQGAPPPEWFFAGWHAQTLDGAHAWGLRSFGGSALFAGQPLLDSAVQLRVRLSNGNFAFGLRQSEAGGYTATFEESGFIRLYRNEQEVGQMFLGPIAGQWRTLRLSAAGNIVRVFLDGAELITFVDDMPLPAGFVTLGGRRSRESRFAIDDLSLWVAEGEAGIPGAAAFAAPLALSAPMALASESASAAGRIPSTLAWSDAFGYDSNDLTLAAPDGTLAEYPGLELAARQPWSPDGQWLLVRMNGDDGLGILNPQTGETRMLTTLPALDDGMRDECPAWSPDGTQVVFLSRRRDGPVPVGGGWTWYPPALYVVAADGQTAPHRIALSTDPDGLVLGCPQWSAVGNGQQVVSLAYQDIYAVDALTGSIVTLYHDDYDLANKLQDPFMLSPDGTKVAFGQIVAAIDVPSNVSVLDLQSGAMVTAAEEKFGEGDSSYFGHWALYTSWDWDDTGTRLAISRDRMVENPTGFGWAYSRDIVISDLAQPCPACSVISVPNSQRTVYVETVIPHPAGVTWSPDGRWIAAVDTLPWDPATGGDALAQLVVLDPVCAERLTVTEPQVWANTYNGWGGFVLVAWQPLPAGPGGMTAFGAGDEYCHVPTETPEPTPLPRDVAPEARAFHALADIFGLPQPFDTYPYDPARFTAPLNFNGYGPTTFAGLYWEDNYGGTYGVHPGIDFGIARSCSKGHPVGNVSDSESWCHEPVVSVCDGVVVNGRATGHGGSSMEGYGISIRCFANQRTTDVLNDSRDNFEIYDVDGDGRPNLSNVVITFNHLFSSLDYVLTQPVANLDYLADPGYLYWNGLIRSGTVVRKGQVIGYTGDHQAYDHLHLEVYLARSYQHPNYPIPINPLLMMSRPFIERLESENILGDYWPAGNGFTSDRYASYGIVIEDGLDEYSQGGTVLGHSSRTEDGNFWMHQDARSGQEGVEWLAYTVPSELGPRWSTPSGSLVAYLLTLAPYSSGSTYPYPNCDVPGTRPVHLVLDCDNSDLPQ